MRQKSGMADPQLASLYMFHLMNRCTPVECVCGHNSCFACGNESHTPVSCVLMERWLDLVGAEANAVSTAAADAKDVIATAATRRKEWDRRGHRVSPYIPRVIDKLTKECPHCRTPIEKTGGCNSMVCICGKEFCWLCLKPHSNHTTGHAVAACHRYEENRLRRSGDESTMSAIAAASAAAENVYTAAGSFGAAMPLRLQHYFTRYANHRIGLQLQRQRFEENRPRLMALLEPVAGGSAVLNNALDRALTTMEHARATLSHT